MKNGSLGWVFFCFFVLGIGFWSLHDSAMAGSQSDKGTSTPEKADFTPFEYRISGPHTHKNLSVYLFHGKDRHPGKSFLTLSEALEQNKAVVYETENVSELAVENFASEEEIFIQAGEIVKGGKQDRVIAVSLIVPAKSGKVPIASFCVEQGRWRPRGNESSQDFKTSSKYLSSKELKLAAKHSKSQQEVWTQVSELQTKLGSNLGKSVRSAQSTSSLQLTLDDEEVKDAAQEYQDQFSQTVRKYDDLIGYAFAINGELNSADLYASRALFKKLWPKLLEASAAEAFANLEKEKSYATPTVEDLENWLKKAREGKAKSRRVTDRVHSQVRESDENVVYGTVDWQLNDVIHLGYIGY